MADVRHYLFRFIWLGLYGILLTPLLLFPWFSSPFITSKVLPFQVLVELVVAAAALIQLGDFAQRGERARLRDLIPTSPFVIAIGGFFVYALISSYLGADFHQSLWSSENRQDGVVLLLHFFGWLGVLSWFARSVGVNSNAVTPDCQRRGVIVSGPLAHRWSYQRYLAFSYVVAILVGITVLLHWVDIRYKVFGIIPEYFNQYDPQRGYGVFGNAEYVGPYLLFHFFYGLYAIWRTLYPSRRAGSVAEAKSGTRTINIILAGVGLSGGQVALLGAIVVGQTRAIMLSALFGLLFIGVRLVLAHRTSWKVKIAAACLALFFVSAAGLVWKYRNSKAFQSVPLLNRLQESNIRITVATRAMVWKSALQGVLDFPLFGWGRSNVQLPLEKYYNPALVQFDYRAADFQEFFWYDKSHNAFIDLLIEAGIVGFMLFIGVAVIIARSWWHISDLAISSCLGAGLLAYMVSNAVAFDSFGSLFGLFLFLGWIDSESIATPISGPRSMQTEPKPRQKKINGLRNVRYHRLYSVETILILAATAVLLYLAADMALASYYRAKALNAFTWNHPDLGLLFYRKALDRFSPYNSREKVRAAILLTKAALNSEPRPVPKDTLDVILNLSRDAEKENIQNPVLLAEIGTVYYNLGLSVDRIYLEQAEACIRRALELSPKRQSMMLVLGNVYLLKAEPGRAASIYKQMVDNYDAFSLAHWYYALALIECNQQPLAKVEIKKALDLGFRFQNEKESRLVATLFGTDEFANLMKGR